MNAPELAKESETIAMLRELYQPTDTFGDDDVYRTTAEVHDIMRQVYPDQTITAGELATEMRLAGYRIEMVGDGPMWLLHPVQRPVL